MGVVTTVVVDVTEEFVAAVGMTVVEVGHGTTGVVATEVAGVVGVTVTSVGTTAVEVAVATAVVAALDPPADESVGFEDEEQPTKPKREATIATDNVFIFTPGSLF